jgi:hypothetical protein
MIVNPLYRSILFSTQRAGQQIHPQPEGQDKQKKIKNETKTPQVAAEEYNIVDIHSKDTP